MICSLNSHLCQLIREIAKQTYLGGAPPNMPPWIITRLSQGHCQCQNLHSLSVSEFTFNVCVRISITLVFCIADIFCNTWHLWLLLLSPGVETYIKARHRDMSVLILPLNHDIYLNSMLVHDLSKDRKLKVFIFNMFDHLLLPV